jgi:riboflavin kinase / FMN adenylyltransferase
VSTAPATVAELGRDALPDIGPAALTMGVFDGVHLGHRALLGATAAAASARGLRSVALVFDPHPDEVLRPGTRVARLAPLDINRGRIEGDLALDLALAIRFDAALRSLSAEEFLDHLRPAIELRAIVMSPESAFGRGRGGTVARLREIGVDAGFEVITVDPVRLGDAVISSARIRQALEVGEIEAATAMGYPPTLVGAADEAGRMAFDYLPALPAAGTYAAAVHAPGEPHHGAPAQVQVKPADDRVAVRWGASSDAARLAGRRLELRLTDAR